MIPKLRFKGFSGEWNSHQLGDIASFQKGKGISKADIEAEGSYKCIRYGELYTEYNEVIDTVVSKTNQPITESVVSEKGDVLIPASGETAIDMATACSLQFDDIILGGDINVIRPAKKVYSELIAYSLSHSKRIQLARVAQGNSVVHIYGKHLSKLKIELPNTEEEVYAIKKILKSVNDKINLLTKKKEALETYKKGLMQKIFSQELRFKREDGTDYPEWISVRLDNLFEIGSSKRILQEFWQEEGVPFYRTRELVSLHNRKPFNSPIFISRQTYEEVVNKYGKPKIGDILCAGVGSIGHFVKVDESFGDFYFKDGNVLIMSPREDISTDFFLFLLYSSQIQKKIHSQSSITTVATFTITDAKRLKVLIPESNEERLRIAELLEGVTKRINLTEDQIANVSKLKKGLLQQMFV